MVAVSSVSVALADSSDNDSDTENNDNVCCSQQTGTMLDATACVDQQASCSCQSDET